MIYILQLRNWTVSIVVCFTLNFLLFTTAPVSAANLPHVIGANIVQGTNVEAKLRENEYASPIGAEIGFQVVVDGDLGRADIISSSWTVNTPVYTVFQSPQQSVFGEIAQPINPGEVKDTAYLTWASPGDFEITVEAETDRYGPVQVLGHISIYAPDVEKMVVEVPTAPVVTFQAANFEMEFEQVTVSATVDPQIFKGSCGFVQLIRSTTNRLSFNTLQQTIDTEDRFDLDVKNPGKIFYTMEDCHPGDPDVVELGDKPGVTLIANSVGQSGKQVVWNEYNAQDDAFAFVAYQADANSDPAITETYVVVYGTSYAAWGWTGAANQTDETGTFALANGNGYGQIRQNQQNSSWFFPKWQASTVDEIAADSWPPVP